MTKLFTPKMPSPKDPAPLPDEEQLTLARRRRVAKETKGSGVQSTMLSGQKETLGS